MGTFFKPNQMKANMHKKIALLVLLAAANAHAFPWYANGGFRGAELMTAAEQQAHTARLQSMKTLDECKAYMGTHEAELQKRATATRATLPLAKGDPCAVMVQMGRIRG